MSESKAVYLVFSAAGGDFAVAAGAVSGMHWLPELVPARLWPAHVVGLFESAHRVVPVVDLGRLLGGVAAARHLSDVVVLVDSGNGTVGVLANEVKRIAAGAVLPVTAGERGEHGLQSVSGPVAGELEVDGDLVSLLDPARLLPSGTPQPGEPFWPEASQRERDTLRRRAAALRQAPEEGLIGADFRYAVVQVGDELLVFGLAQVEAFARVGRITPVPCTPGHIRGSMNLRGATVTVVDLLAALGLGQSRIETTGSLAVVRQGELLAGFYVSEIRQLTAMKEGKPKAKPGLSTQVPEFVRGEFLIGGEPATLIDLKKLLTADTLIVDEQVG